MCNHFALINVLNRDKVEENMFSEEQIKKFYRYCMTLTKNEEDAQDLLQTGLEKWLLASMDEIKAPESYFYRILRNTFIDYVRKVSRREISPLDTVEESKIISLNEKELEDFVADKQSVEKLMGELSDQDREVLYFWAVEGYSFQEISKLMDVPKGTLLARMHRMKKKITTNSPELVSEVF